MKKRRIKKISIRKEAKKKIAKVCLTMFIICMCPAIYEAVTLLGESVKTSDISLVLVVLGWFWLMAGQVFTLSFIWEK